MTPEETAMLQGLGLGLIGGLSWLLTLTMLYGVFILLFAISTAMIIRRGLKNLPQRAMFAVTLLSFIIASLHLAAQLAGATILVRSGLVENPELSLPERFANVVSKEYQPNSIIMWTTQILPIISDAVVLWRAWVLFPQQKWVMVPSVALWIGLIATSFAYIALQVNPAVIADAVDGLNIITGNLLTASISLSIATNATATLLIGYKLWSHRKVVVKNLGLSGRKSQVQNVLIVLIESGVVYGALQIVTLILTLVPDNNGQGSAQFITGEVFFATYTLLSAMSYPRDRIRELSAFVRGHLWNHIH